MPALVWDALGERFYEYGVSKGVIYMQDGRNIVWNGLTSVTQAPERSVTPVYYDGMKINDLVSPAEFSGTISAITYPDEVLELEGVARLSAGIYLGEQDPQQFNFTYQTKLGNDTVGPDLGYRIHVLYNVTMIAGDRDFQSMSNQIDLDPFTWDITTVPQEVAGFMPSSRIMIDSKAVPEDLLSDIEFLLYGRDTADPNPPSFDELVEIVRNFLVVDILDRKDGTWSATTNVPGYIIDVSPTEFEIRNVNAEYISADIYEVSDT